MPRKLHLSMPYESYKRRKARKLLREQKDSTELDNKSGSAGRGELEKDKGAQSTAHRQCNEDGQPQLYNQERLINNDNENKDNPNEIEPVFVCLFKTEIEVKDEPLDDHLVNEFEELGNLSETDKSHVPVVNQLQEEDSEEELPLPSGVVVKEENFSEDEEIHGSLQQPVPVEFQESSPEQRICNSIQSKANGGGSHGRQPYDPLLDRVVGTLGHWASGYNNPQDTGGRANVGINDAGPSSRLSSRAPLAESNLHATDVLQQEEDYGPPNLQALLKGEVIKVEVIDEVEACTTPAQEKDREAPAMHVTTPCHAQTTSHKRPSKEPSQKEIEVQITKRKLLEENNSLFQRYCNLMNESLARRAEINRIQFEILKEKLKQEKLKTYGK